MIHDLLTFLFTVIITDFSFSEPSQVTTKLHLELRTYERQKPFSQHCHNDTDNAQTTSYKYSKFLVKRSCCFLFAENNFIARSNNLLVKWDVQSFNLLRNLFLLSHKQQNILSNHKEAWRLEKRRSIVFRYYDIFTDHVVSVHLKWKLMSKLLLYGNTRYGLQTEGFPYRLTILDCDWLKLGHVSEYWLLIGCWHLVTLSSHSEFVSCYKIISVTRHLIWQFLVNKNKTQQLQLKAFRLYKRIYLEAICLIFSSDSCLTKFVYFITFCVAKFMCNKQKLYDTSSRVSGQSRKPSQNILVVFWGSWAVEFL